MNPSAPAIPHPLMFQSWCNLTFLHWRYPVEALRPYVPPPLELDVFEGSAWIGVTPFLLRGLRPPGFPPLPWISRFPETNCRTYVRAPDGSAGIWFFSLEAGRAAAVIGARAAFGLPYAWADMQVTHTGARWIYRSARFGHGPRARTHIEVEPGERIQPDSLAKFLTARFRLYSFVLGRLMYVDVEHPPWPLQSARVVAAEQTLTAAAGLPEPAGLPLAHFSPGVHVRIGAPHRLLAGRPAGAIDRNGLARAR